MSGMFDMNGPGDHQYAFSVATHLQDKPGYWAVMIRGNGTAGVDGPFETYDSAEMHLRLLLDAVTSSCGEGIVTEKRVDVNGQTTYQSHATRGPGR